MQFKTFTQYGICGFLLFLAIPKASAGCVMSDVNSQYVISSASAPPPTQTNDLNIQFGQNCLGNSSHGNNQQIYFGDGQVDQNRQRNVTLDSQSDYDTSLSDTPNVSATIDQKLDLPILP
jgi:hypothetical protein